VIELKTIRTIATAILAAFLVLGPAMAFAAGETVTVATDQGSYTGNAIIHVSGTVTPAPTGSNTAVTITTKAPNGAAVDINTASVAVSSGAYTYTIAAGSSLWMNSGTYTINATYGGPGGTGSGTATFSYQFGAGGGGGGTTTVTTTITNTATVTTTIASATVTSTVVNPDSAALTAIQSSISAQGSQLSSMQTAINAINSGVSGITTTLSSLSTGLSQLNTVGSQLTSVTNAINNNQTYVLVVAALAAITLVLELAILVRKLS
jgi:hypothetical protein